MICASPSWFLTIHLSQHCTLCSLLQRWDKRCLYDNTSHPSLPLWFFSCCSAGLEQLSWGNMPSPLTLHYSNLSLGKEESLWASSTYGNLLSVYVVLSQPYSSCQREKVYCIKQVLLKRLRRSTWLIKTVNVKTKEIVQMGHLTNLFLNLWHAHTTPPQKKNQSKLQGRKGKCLK